MTVSARIADDTAVDPPTLRLSSLETGQFSSYATMTRIAGEAQEGTYEATFNIPEGAATGIWAPHFVYFKDTLGNVTQSLLVLRI